MSQGMKSIHQKLKGFVSLEIALVLIISAIIGFALLQQQARAAKKEVAKIQADQLIQIADALNSYSDLYRRNLVSPGDLEIDLGNDGTIDVVIPQNAPAGTAPEGGKLTPSIANLIAAGLLPPGFQNSPAASNGQFISRLSIQPASCSPANNDCRIEGYVTLTQPVTTGGQNPAAGQFDGDVLGDALGFLGGNGFATLAAGQSAVSSGGNFTVNVDLNNDGTLDSGAGLIGMRVGALATRQDTNDPIAGVDYCPGTPLIGWLNGATTVTTFNDQASYDSFDSGGGPGDKCKSPGFSDVPAGYTFSILDATEPKTGVIRFLCGPNPAVPGTVSVRVDGVGCCKGSGSC